MSTPVCPGLVPAPVSEERVCAFLKVKAPTASERALLSRALSVAEGCFHYGVCYRVLPLTLCSEGVLVGSTRFCSKALAAHLQGCGEVLLFAATIGLAMDRLIRRYSAVNTGLALTLDALGNERIEALCDAFCQRIREGLPGVGNREITPRFSPGYGDLSLSVQSALFALLEPSRHIGLSLSEHLLMTPTKSVSAIVGLRPAKP